MVLARDLQIGEFANGGDENPKAKVRIMRNKSRAAPIEKCPLSLMATSNQASFRGSTPSSFDTLSKQEGKTSFLRGVNFFPRSSVTSVDDLETSVTSFKKKG